MKENEEIKVLEFYSGIGGMHYALKSSGIKFEVIGAFDINTNANMVYRHNFPNVKLMQKNLEGITVVDLEKLSADCWTMSPPCQPYTRQGKQDASKDARARSFLHILDLLRNMEHPPKYLLIENVKGFESSDTRDVLIETLKHKGYHFKEYLTTPTDFGIPNSRLRYYLLAKSSISFVSNTEFSSGTWSNAHNSHCISDFLDPKSTDQAEFLLEEKTLKRFHNILDIVDENASISCCFTKAYGKYVEGTGSVFTSCTKSDVKPVYDKLGSNISDSEKMELLKSLKLRYFSPREIAGLLYFPADFQFPSEMTTRQKYQLLGNSVNVRVIGFLMKEFLFSKP